MDQTVSVTLWSVNMGQTLRSRQEWIEQVDRVATEAVAQGSDVLVLPEYVSELWLTYCGAGLAPTQEVAAMAKEGEAMHAPMREIAERHKIALLAGSWPAAANGSFCNRAHLFVPGRKYTIVQDKMCLTPGEKNPDGWSLGVGKEFNVFEWNGLKCAMVICLDIEMPALSTLIAREAPDIDLIFVPSMTEKLSGYHRVFGCAKARGVELMTCLCVVGCVGATPLGVPRPNVSGGAVYLPCEEAFGFTGTLAQSTPCHQADDHGPRLHVSDIPVGAVRNQRARGTGEVWPGAWNAAGIAVKRV